MPKPRTIPKITLLCSYCGKKFEVWPSESNQKFCSWSCYLKATKRRVVKICPVCKKEFEVPLSNIRRKFCSRDCYKKSEGLREHLRKISILGARPGIPKKWNLTEEEARKLFEEYKKSNQRLDEYAKSVGTCAETLRKLFLRYFPGEYQDFIELKMDRKTSAYERGRNFEYRVKAHYERQGYIVMRSAKSKGLMDLIAIRPSEILFIECEVGGYLRADKKEKLVSLANSVGAKALFIKRGRAPKYELIIEGLN